MTDETPNPFVSGARVAIRTDGRWNVPAGYREAFVDKVFKTGRFTLRDSPQQWRPYKPGYFQKHWHASATGTGNGDLRIWDESADAEIREAIATRQRYDRFATLKHQIDYLPFSAELVTDDVINDMERVVLAVKVAK